MIIKIKLIDGDEVSAEVSTNSCSPITKCPECGAATVWAKASTGNLIPISFNAVKAGWHKHFLICPRSEEYFKSNYITGACL
jgi:hypothetical protein